MHSLLFTVATIPLALALPQPQDPTPTEPAPASSISPQSAVSPAATPTGTVDILTSFLGYDGCNDTRKSILEQNIKDAVRLAEAGIDQRHDELSTLVVPDIDFDKQAALDFFGPTGQNGK